MKFVILTVLAAILLVHVVQSNSVESAVAKSGADGQFIGITYGVTNLEALKKSIKEVLAKLQKQKAVP